MKVKKGQVKTKRQQMLTRISRAPESSKSAYSCSSTSSFRMDSSFFASPSPYDSQNAYMLMPRPHTPITHRITSFLHLSMVQ